jgi:BASS family bile acid:Na+ symporter
MSVLRLPLSALAWLGRQGTRAVAALLAFGILLPPAGAFLKAYVAEAVFVLLCIAFLQVDLAALRSYLRRPALVIAATAWTALGVPFLIGVACLAVGLDTRNPDLFVGIMLQAVASPMMAAPAFAALMGLDATLVLVTLVTTTALVPVTAPLFASLFVGPILSVSPLELAAKLFAILAGAAAVGLILRRILDPALIRREREKIAGFNILVLFVFVAALMEGVGPRFLAAPLHTTALAALAFLMFFAVLAASVLLFLFAGRAPALALAFMTCQRNTGLMLAATAGQLPELAWLYFALCQFPIYLSPYLLQPVARRLLARGADAAAAPDARS